MGNDSARGSEPTGCGNVDGVADHGDFGVVEDHGDFVVVDHFDDENKCDELCFTGGGGSDTANSASRLRKFRC